VLVEVELEGGLGNIQAGVDGGSFFRHSRKSCSAHSCTYEHVATAAAQSTVRVTDNRHERLRLPREHVQTVPEGNERARAAALRPAGRRAAPSSRLACRQTRRMKNQIQEGRGEGENSVNFHVDILWRFCRQHLRNHNTLFGALRRGKSGRGLPHSKTLRDSLRLPARFWTAPVLWRFCTDGQRRTIGSKRRTNPSTNQKSQIKNQKSETTLRRGKSGRGLPHSKTLRERPRQPGIPPSARKS
jgi:hypothetical protein